jgi:hypothetical protein
MLMAKTLDALGCAGEYLKQYPFELLDEYGFVPGDWDQESATMDRLAPSDVPGRLRFNAVGFLIRLLCDDNHLLAVHDDSAFYDLTVFIEAMKRRFLESGPVVA